MCAQFKRCHLCDYLLVFSRHEPSTVSYHIPPSITPALGVTPKNPTGLATRKRTIQRIPTHRHKQLAISNIPVPLLLRRGPLNPAQTRALVLPRKVHRPRRSLPTKQSPRSAIRHTCLRRVKRRRNINEMENRYERASNRLSQDGQERVEKDFWSGK
jgi:hypothetical protein